jgi:hypothetical protein
LKSFAWRTNHKGDLHGNPSQNILGGSRHHHPLETLSNLRSKTRDPKNIDMPKRQKIKIK